MGQSAHAVMKVTAEIADKSSGNRRGFAVKNLQIIAI